MKHTFLLTCPYSVILYLFAPYYSQSSVYALANCDGDGVADARVDVKRGVVVCTNKDYPYMDTAAIAGGKQVFGIAVNMLYCVSLKWMKR